MKFYFLGIALFFLSTVPSVSESIEVTVGDWEVTQESDVLCDMEYSSKGLFGFGSGSEYIWIYFDNPDWDLATGPSVWIEAPRVKQYVPREEVPVYLRTEDHEERFSMSFAAHGEYVMMLGGEYGETTASELSRFIKALSHVKSGEFSFHVQLRDGSLDEVVSFDLEGTSLAAKTFRNCARGL